MTSRTAPPLSSPPPAFRRLDPGVLLTPDRPEWDRTRSVWNLAIDQRPRGDRPRPGDELYGEPAHARLSAIKRAYDPDGVIHANPPVAPS